MFPPNISYHDLINLSPANRHFKPLDAPQSILAASSGTPKSILSHTSWEAIPRPLVPFVIFLRSHDFRAAKYFSLLSRDFHTLAASICVIYSAWQEYFIPTRLIFVSLLISCSVF
jgi:hypothetical protein